MPADGSLFKMQLKRRNYTLKMIFVVLGAAILLNAYAVLGESPERRDSAILNNDSLLDQTVLFKSNRYVQPESLQAKPENRFDLIGFDLVAKSGSIELYADMEELVFRIKNLTNGYVWSSAPLKSDYDPDKYNEEWISRLNSPFVISYVNSETMQERETSFKSGKGRITAIEKLENGVRYNIYLDAVEIGLILELKLENGELVVRVPEEGLKEDGNAKVLSIQLLPYFGAALPARTPGYIFVPDGCGALMRFTEHHPFYDEAYVGMIYDIDYSVKFFTQKQNEAFNAFVLVPVFGMVHGPGYSAWMCVVEDGKYNAEIVAVPSGVNTDFNAVSPRFIYRYTYYQPTSKNMGGVNTFQKNRITGDRQARYIFLTGDSANYSGMASSYRKYLLDRGKLPGKISHVGQIPLHLALLGAENEPGLIWPNTVAMTSFYEAMKIVGSLKESGIANAAVTYVGWNKQGASMNQKYKTEVEAKLGGAEGLKQFGEYARSLGYRVFLERDYDWFASGARNFQPRTDAIRLINNEVFRVHEEDYKGNKQEFFYANPRYALRAALYDNERISRMLGSFGSCIPGWWIFSDFNDRSTVTREEAAYLKVEAASSMRNDNGLMIKEPFEFYWKYMSDAIGLPMYNSQLAYFTDTVPFIQMLLHGYANYYSEEMNLSANSRELLLKSIEFGAYPSFLITAQPTWKLQNTPAGYVFSSEFSEWKDEICRIYNIVNDVLKGVANAEMTEHEAVANGVVRVGYSNGTSIIVNYTDKPFIFRGVEIKAQDCAVIKEGGY